MKAILPWVMALSGFILGVGGSLFTLQTYLSPHTHTHTPIVNLPSSLSLSFPKVQATAGTANFVGGTGTVTAAKFIDSANSAYTLTPSATGNSLLVAGKVGIGTTNPGYTLDVNGTGNFATSLTVAGATGGVVPAGAILYFNATSCPSGWTEFTSARGNYIVGRVSSGTLNTQVGTALTNQENRPVGQHTHTINDPGHSHYVGVDNNSPYDAGQLNVAGPGNVNRARYTSSSTTGITINNTGSVAGTNAPYIQLLVCQKS